MADTKAHTNGDEQVAEQVTRQGKGTTSRQKKVKQGEKYRKKILVAVCKKLDDKARKRNDLADIPSTPEGYDEWLRDEKRKRIEDVDEEIQTTLQELSKVYDDIDVFPLLLEAPSISITAALVDDVFEALRWEFGKSHDKLMVVLSSSGGDMDAAYSLAMLFRRYGSKRLAFIIPRTAKSAATLMACSGDEILMNPVAELGPVDAQITHASDFDGRHEKFSALHIKTTLQLINEQYKGGDQWLAEALIKRLQYPLTLGSFRRSLDIGKLYTRRLLVSRMLKDDPQKAKDIAHKLVEGYESHNSYIDHDEAVELGLTVRELDGEALDLIWRIHRLEGIKIQLLEQLRGLKKIEELKKLPSHEVPKEHLASLQASLATLRISDIAVY